LLNYRLNRAQDSNLKIELEHLRNEQWKNVDGSSFVQQCLKRLFDNNGNLQKTFVDSETMLEVKKAQQDHTTQSLQGDTYCVARGYSSLQSDEISFEKGEKDASLKIDELGNSLASNEQEFKELTKGQQDFKSMAQAWDHTRSSSFPYINIPYDLLVILLVMMMGALGGVVRLVQDFGSSRHHNPGFEDYILDPAIGSVVAIGGYVLAKTGLLLLSSTKGETSLSPYMIGLVGIISGLLANDVILKIAESGQKILQHSPAGEEHDKDPAKVDAQAAAPKQGGSGQGESTK
jgi:hypothetical protein